MLKPSQFELQLFSKTVNIILEKAIRENRLLNNPSDDQLRLLLEKEPGVKKTLYGNYVAESDPTSRAAMFTENSVDHLFGDEEYKLLELCEKRLRNQTLISIDRLIGSKDSETTVRLIVPSQFAHVAYGGKNLFLPITRPVKRPTHQIVFFFDHLFQTNRTKKLPDKDITIRLAMLDDGRVIKIVRNSNYIGEYKKGVFAAENWAAKIHKNGLFLHAGCRQDYLQSSHGDYLTVTTLIVGLSANGKTSTTCKILARKGMEMSWLIQDDGGVLMSEGSFHGFEGNGLFVKTEGVNPGNQREIFYSLLKPGTLLENVHVTENGDLDFFNLAKTSNGRAVIQRRDLMHSATHINVEKIDNLLLITRGPTIPAIAQLTREQAVALMIMGQAMESSAGDPTMAGKIRSEFFYDPFVAGNRTNHAKKFYELMQNSPQMNYYLLNTGGIGEGSRYKEITLEHTLGILDSLMRGELEDWTDSPTGFKVPKSVRTVDNIYFHPELLYNPEEFAKLQRDLNALRRETIQKLGNTLSHKIQTIF